MHVPRCGAWRRRRQSCAEECRWLCFRTPIVPVALVGMLQALPMNHYVIKPNPFRVVFGEPISTEGYTPRDMEKLSATVRKALEDVYYSHAEIADPRTGEE